MRAAAGGIREYSTGMLVVESVVPGGPADGVLEPGDVLVSRRAPTPGGWGVLWWDGVMWCVRLSADVGV